MGSSREIVTGNVQLVPPNISEVVDLFLNAAPATTIPIDGRIEYLFPKEVTQVPFETDEGCVLEVPPLVSTVECLYSFIDDPSSPTQRVLLSASGFSLDIETDSFFTLRVPGFVAPRSTAETSSFEFTSFTSEGEVLDTQTRGLVAKAIEYHEIKQVQFTSTSEVVGMQGAFLQVTFTTLDELEESDWIQVTLPKWNPQASFPSPMITYEPDALQCSGLEQTKESISCFLERGRFDDKVKLFKPLLYTAAAAPDLTEDGVETTTTTSESIPIGTKISFTIGPIQNPISAAPATGFKLDTLSAQLGNIAVGDGFLQVTDFAIIDASEDPEALTLFTSETLINQESIFTLEVDMPVPLNAGCQIDLTIPEPLLIGPELTRVVIGGLLGQVRDASITIDASRNLITIDDACRSYRQNVAAATFELRSLVNPGYVITSKSFHLEVRDVDGNKIVQTEGGLTYTTTPGTLTIPAWYASNREVSALSDIQFAIQPLDPTASRLVQIRVVLPPGDFERLPEPSCVVSYTNQLVSDEDTWSCSTLALDSTTTTKAIVLDATLKEPWRVRSGERISFTIAAIEMPSSIRPTGDYTVEVYDTIDGVYRLVDVVTVQDMLRALPGGLQAVQVEPLLGTTYTDDTMTFSVALGHKVLQGGQLVYSMPEELSFTEGAACIGFSEGVDSDAVCHFYPAQNRFDLTRGFKTSDYTQLETPVQVTVGGIFTPRSQLATSTFDVRTYDQQGFLIDTHSSFFLPAFRVDKVIDTVSVVQSDNEVGALATFDLFLRAPYPLKAGDLLTLTIPSQASKTLSETFVSLTPASRTEATTSSYLANDLYSTLIGVNSVQVTIDFAPSASASQSSPIEEIPIDMEIGFRLTSLQNPQSTKPSQSFTVTVTDGRRNHVVSITDDPEALESFVMHATKPAKVIFAEVQTDVKQALEPTLIQMRLVTAHELPVNSQLRISVPQELGLPDSDDSLSCWVDSAPFGDIECEFDREALTFNIPEINPYGKVRGGSTLLIELKGFSNRAVAAPTSTFTAMTLTSEGYAIDEVTEGLTVAANCDWPCWQCPVGQPDKCLACDTREGSLLPLFYDGTCRDDCPSNYFVMNDICSQCAPGCLECDLNRNKCLECHFGSYLLGNKCLTECPATHHEIIDEKKCELCASPCKTCEGSLTNCTSCDQSTPYLFFFRNQCFETCPRDISVEDEGLCYECSDNCKTCDSDYSSNFCTSCYGNDFLDFHTNTCVETCPSGLTVANTSAFTPLGQTQTCELCNSNCLTCSDYDTEICLECRDGLKMIETSKSCVSECPAGTAEVWLPLTQDTVCAECAPGCLACENSRQHCTVCKNDFVFYDFTCLLECPEGYTAETEGSDGVCVRERPACPSGQAYSAEGVCELIVAVCEVGYTLNSSETECIPEPGIHVPFAFLYAALGWAIFILWPTNRRRMSRENLVSQLLLGLTFLAQFSAVVQLLLSYKMGFSVLTSFHTLALFVVYFCNALTLVAVHWKVKDKPFEHWRDQYTREYRIIIACSCLYSFKSSRILYSNFLAKAYFNAPFDQLFRQLIRPFFIVTMVSMVQMAAICIANAYALWKLRWGYEIVTLAVSSLCLQVLIFCLEVYEFVLFKRKEPGYLGVGDYFKNQMTLGAKQRAQLKAKERRAIKRSQVRVMSFLPNDDQSEVGIPPDSANLASESDDINAYTSHLPLNHNQSHLDQSSKALGGGLNMSSKQLLPSDTGANQGEGRRSDATFKFENIPMVKQVKVDRDRIDFGEQGQAMALKQMITRLDEHSKVKRIERDLDQIALKEKAAFDGTELPLTEYGLAEDQLDPITISVDHNQASLPLQSQHKNIIGQAAVVDRYLDESIRKRLLVSSTKEKQKLFREKRQRFERHRHTTGKHLNSSSVAAACVSDAYQGVDDSGPGYFSDFESRQVGGGLLPKEGQRAAKNKGTQMMLTTVQMHEGAKSKYLDILQNCDEDELQRDKLVYDHFYVQFKRQFDDKARKGELVPNARLNQSFDEEVLREMYDDFGVCSDFESEVSWISYPPNKGFLKDYYENNPVKQAENELFKQKIKVKFQYNNMYRESYVVPPRPQLVMRPAVKTQTDAADLVPEEVPILGTTKSMELHRQVIKKTVDLDFDPFESEEEFVLEESEQLSAIDEAIIGQNIVGKVIEEGFSDVDSSQIGRLETKTHHDISEAGDRLDSHSDLLLSPGPEEKNRRKKGGTSRRTKKGSKRNKSQQVKNQKLNQQSTVTKKRKRSGTIEDFTARQVQAKREPQANRVGLNGRATDTVGPFSLAAQNAEAKRIKEAIESSLPGEKAPLGTIDVLGDVYDTQGHLVYDKEYISQMDDDGISSVKSGSQHNSAGRTSTSKHRDSRLSAPPISNNQGAGNTSGDAASVDRKSTKSHLKAPSTPEVGSTFDKRLPSTKQAEESQEQPVGQRRSERLSDDKANQHDFINTVWRETQDAEAAERQARDKGMSKRDKQMVKAYQGGQATHDPLSANKLVKQETEPDRVTPVGGQQYSPGQTANQSRRKSKTAGAGVSRKRKRFGQDANQLILSNATGNQSNRGLTDARDQLEQDMQRPDNGILELVINNNQDNPSETTATLIQQQPTDSQSINAFNLTDKKGQNESSDALGDQETRGGNLSSSHGYAGGAHQGNTTMGGYMTAVSGAGLNNQNASGGPEQRHGFMGGRPWESDAASSSINNQALLSGFQGRKQDAFKGFDSSPSKEGQSPKERQYVRTDDETTEAHLRRRQNLNQTEIVKKDHHYHPAASDQEGGNTFYGDLYGSGPREEEGGTQGQGQIVNWSDDGGQVAAARQAGYGAESGSQEGDGDTFGRLGQSYSYGKNPMHRKMTQQQSGPQPFMQLGVQSQPYKARRKRQNEQLLADQRRAKFSMGSDRMNKLESIYLKNTLAGSKGATATPGVGQGLPPRGANQSISQPRADSLTVETMQVFRRHQKAGNDSAGLYRNIGGSASNVSRQPRRLGPKQRRMLHKQNFIEDGQNIIVNTTQDQSRSRPHGRANNLLNLDSSASLLNEPHSQTLTQSRADLDSQPHWPQVKRQLHNRTAGAGQTGPVTAAMSTNSKQMLDEFVANGAQTQAHATVSHGGVSRRNVILSGQTSQTLVEKQRSAF